MKEVRCKKCNKLLGKVYTMFGATLVAHSGDMKLEPVSKSKEFMLFDENGNLVEVSAVVEIKCPRCGEMNAEKGSVEDEEKS